MISMLAAIGAAAQAGGTLPPAGNPDRLRTRWADEVKPDRVHPEYPRPQMVRSDWLNLNGLWDYAIRPRSESRPPSASFDGQILVPFPVESALSGVMKPVGEDQQLWYRRTFEIPAGWAGRRVLLNFGAVDWETSILVNGRQIGTHRGGYDSFSFDITDALKPTGPQELLVCVWDPTDAGTQPRGKQVRAPHGIWYTPTTGIWQTVWLEPVPERRIDGLRVTPDLDNARVVVQVDEQYLGPDQMVDVAIMVEGRIVARGSGRATVEIPLRGARRWSPADPYLYDLRVTLRRSDEPRQVVDEVTGYFGMRKIEVARDKQGILRLFLNGEPLFMLGLLDQGFWPDGLYTAPTDEALRYDIEMTRKLGFNTIRKHVKIEPQRWYYWCDKLGVLVWQDMPSGDAFAGGDRTEIQRSAESAAQFEQELQRLIDTHYSHPSIVMWVLFNEGWGQYDTARLTGWIEQHDPTRLVNAASGWHDLGVGDVHDIHVYPGPAAPQREDDRAIVLGEFGGLGLAVPDHLWQPEGSWGYRSFQTAEQLTEAYVSLLETLRLLAVEPGLSAAIYTQTTDVEIEINGLLTYDRAMVKPDAERTAAANRRMFLALPAIRSIAPTSQRSGVPWRYTTNQPAAGWENSDFDDSSWPEGVGGFGRTGTPGIVVRTAWETPDIWLRRSFDAVRPLARPYLHVHHDEDCEIYLNGKLVASLTGYTTSYVFVPLPASAVQVGRNLIAVHCHQTAGGQGIDVGLVDVVERTH